MALQSFAEPDGQARPTGYRRRRWRWIVGGLAWALLMVVLSVTKGWFAFFLVPALVPILPVTFAIQAWAFRVLERPKGLLDSSVQRVTRWVGALAPTQVVLITLVYLCVPLAGDTDESTAFTFIWADIDSHMVAVSSGVATVSGVGAGVVTILLLGLLAFATIRGRRAVG